MGEWLNLSWKVLIVRGIVGVVFGVLAMTWPELTILTLVIIWGIWALADAVMSATAVFASGSDTGTRVFFGLIALAGLIAGLFALLRPGVAAVTITWFLGIWLIVRGVLTLVSAFSPSTGSRGIVILSAAIDVLLGILLVANPGRAALDIAWVLGLVAIIWGVALIVIGILTRKALKDLPTDPMPQPAG